MIDRFLHRLDAFQRRHRLIRFSFAVIKKYGEDEAGYQAALITYYGFLSIFPLFLVLTTVVKFLGVDSAIRTKIVTDAVTYVPLLGQELQNNVQGLHNSGLALIFGLLVTVYGARGIADVLRYSINHFWEIPRLKRLGFPWSLLRSLEIIIVGGFGLLLAPILASYASAVGHGALPWILSSVVTLVCLFGIFLFLIQTSLPKKQPFRLVWPSSLAAAVGLSLLQIVGTQIIASQLKHLNTLYGTFALVLGLLFWLYLQAQVIVYALEAGSVRVLGLYPRSLVQENLTPADTKAFHLYAARNHFHHSIVQSQPHTAHPTDSE